MGVASDLRSVHSDRLDSRLKKKKKEKNKRVTEKKEENNATVSCLERRGWFIRE